MWGSIGHAPNVDGKKMDKRGDCKFMKKAGAQKPAHPK